jgi:hypothetical protein
VPFIMPDQTFYIKEIEDNQSIPTSTHTHTQVYCLDFNKPPRTRKLENQD